MEKLNLHAKPAALTDGVFDLSDLQDDPVSFSFFIGPVNLVFPNRAIKLGYELEGYSLAISVDHQASPVPNGYEEYFTTLVPEQGPCLRQQMAEDQAIIAYHQAITGSKGPILYSPNGEGVIRLIFEVPMWIAPTFEIELNDHDLHVIDQDVEREIRSEKVMLKFKVRNCKTGRIMRQLVAVRSILLSAEL